jgi:hypothetical protein
MVGVAAALAVTAALVGLATTAVVLTCKRSCNRSCKRIGR